MEDASGQALRWFFDNWVFAAGIPTYASSGLFSKPTEMYAHGLNERLPVKSFYEGLEHVYRLAVELGGAEPGP